MAEGLAQLKGRHWLDLALARMTRCAKKDVDLSQFLWPDTERPVGGIADVRTSQRGKIMFRLFSVCLAFLFATAASAQIEFRSRSRLKAITSTKTIKIAYRADARPFSFVNDKNEPVGFTIDLCRLVANSIGQQFGLGDLKIDWVPTTLQTRFTTVASGKADMECGSSTATLGRMKDVDFSNFV